MAEIQLVWGCDRSRQFEQAWLQALLQPLQLTLTDADPGASLQRRDPHQPLVLVESGLLRLESQVAADRLQRQRQQLTEEATEHRRQLLALAADVKAWTDRTERARSAGATDLARRASQHCTQLMEQGRGLWGDLASLGRRFEEVDRQLSDINRQQKKPSTLEDDWASFAAEQELEELRRRTGRT